MNGSDLLMSIPAGVVTKKFLLSDVRQHPLDRRQTKDLRTTISCGAMAICANSWWKKIWLGAAKK